MCALLPHVPHPPRSPICICSINQGTIYPCAPLPMCPIAHVPHCLCVKKMSSCQKDVKLSKRCQMSKSQTHRLWRRFTKKKIDIMRLTHIDVNFDIKCEGHQNCSKTLSLHILRVFGDHHMWHQNWCQYVWTSLCQFIFFMNLIHSLYVFDFLTFDIFLTIWHLYENLTSFWHMSNVAHGQWGTWHLFDTFKLKPPQPVTGLFLVIH